MGVKVDVENKQPVSSLPGVSQGYIVLLLFLNIWCVKEEPSIVDALQFKQHLVDIRVWKDESDHTLLLILNFRRNFGASILYTFWILLI